MKDRKEVKLVSAGQACAELNSRQTLFYDMNAGHWWLQIQTSGCGVATAILNEEVLHDVYRVASGGKL